MKEPKRTYAWARKQVIAVAAEFGAWVPNYRYGTTKDKRTTIMMQGTRCAAIGVEPSGTPEPMIDRLMDVLGTTDVGFTVTRATSTLTFGPQLMEIYCFFMAYKNKAESAVRQLVESNLLQPRQQSFSPHMCDSWFPRETLWEARVVLPLELSRITFKRKPKTGHTP